ncbi:MAG: 50S ribosomal protein L20 [Chloroflexi bacterium]|nr:50S ribosomal protein L20 [Chloroflexota bacterium]
MRLAYERNTPLPRASNGVTKRQRHKKVLKITKGQRGTKHALFRRANEAMLASLKYATRDRRNRKRDLRRLWIMRINAAARQNGMSYSRFMEGLRLSGVEVNRKMLADMAVQDPSAFTALVQVARQARAEV